MKKHAEVKMGEYTVPLIGVPVDATKETCSICHKEYHLTEVIFVESNLVCNSCLKEKEKK